MDLRSDHFRDQSRVRFGYVMSVDEAEQRWSHGKKLTNREVHHLGCKFRPGRLYRSILFGAVVIVRDRETGVFVTIFSTSEVERDH